jgi:hypothetical protein
LLRLAVLFASFDSATAFVRSTIAEYVPTRQVDHENVADAPGARLGTVNVPTSVIERTEGPAVALPRFVTVTVNFANDEITRSGSGFAIVQLCDAGGPVFPAGSVARTENVCVPTGSDV